jgi:hypothetical protein
MDDRQQQWVETQTSPPLKAATAEQESGLRIAARLLGGGLRGEW